MVKVTATTRTAQQVLVRRSERVYDVTREEMAANFRNVEGWMEMMPGRAFALIHGDTIEGDITVALLD